MNNKKSYTRIIWIILGFLVARYTTILPQVSYSSTASYVHTTADSAIEQEGIEHLRQIYSTLVDQYYDKDKISLSGMWDGGLKGFVNAINDPYTEYFTIEQNTDFTESLKGEEDFEGIGAAVAKKDEGIEIQEVYKGTPAAVAGLKPLDLVLEINGEKTTNMTLADAVDKIRGPKDTVVNLTIYRASEKDSGNSLLKVDVTRKEVQIPSVAVETVKKGNKNIGVITIAVIGEQTEVILKNEIAALLTGGNIDGVLLDLRGNGGGYLPKAVEIASHFLPKGKTVVTAKYANHPDEEYVSLGYAELSEKPLIILVDGLTASAGEIIAGALQQLRGAKLVGVTTYGKGSIQTLADIGSGAGLKYTIGKWFLPDNTNIDHEGLTPDIVVEFDREQYEKNAVDVQKNKAFDELQKLLH